MSYYGFKPYVSVAKRRAKALREMKKLKKKGLNVCPIEIEKRKITHTFWGNAWCDHIESFSDYDNRLPRGRTYVRNGSVCHLAISKGRVEAIVSGSELYNVCINISMISNEQWGNIKKTCAGKIGSLLDLLSGKLSDGVMQVVCDRNHGLFPRSKGINLSCDCPDWADMCKHVAAVLYGVGARLDHSPEKLFELRGVDYEELIDTSTVVIDTSQGASSNRRRIDHDAMADVFDIDISDAVTTPPAKASKKRASKNPKIAKRSKSSHVKNTEISSPLPKYFSGDRINKKRKQLNLTQREFAKRVGVSATTISNWEGKGRQKLNLREGVKGALQILW